MESHGCRDSFRIYSHRLRPLSNPVNSFMDVMRQVVLHPVEFYSMIPRCGNLLAPLIFSRSAISIILGGFLRIIVGREAIFSSDFRFEAGGWIGYPRALRGFASS